jgi:hypothetical protein
MGYEILCEDAYVFESFFEARVLIYFKNVFILSNSVDYSFFFQYCNLFCFILYYFLDFPSVV